MTIQNREKTNVIKRILKKEIPSASRKDSMGDICICPWPILLTSASTPRQRERPFFRGILFLLVTSILYTDPQLACILAHATSMTSSSPRQQTLAVSTVSSDTVSISRRAVDVCDLDTSNRKTLSLGTKCHQLGDVRKQVLLLKVAQSESQHEIQYGVYLLCYVGNSCFIHMQKWSVGPLAVVYAAVWV